MIFRPLLEGEDAAAYDELLNRVRDAVKPNDFIEEIYVSDVVSLEWEVIRWRRLKISLMQAGVNDATRDFLSQHLDYEDYRDSFAELSAILLHESYGTNLSADKAHELAFQYADSEPGAVEKVERLLRNAFVNIARVHHDAKDQTAKELVLESSRGDASSLERINQLLDKKGRSRDDLMLGALSSNFGKVERIDQQITAAETRRNMSLREIDRRRVMLGEALRRALPEVELKVIETKPLGEKESN